MKQPPLLRRVYVTLLEMLIVLAILALIAGALAYNINNAVIDQRFRTEVGRVVDVLRLAQDLMLILGTDVHVKFAQDEAKGGIKYWLEMETALEEPWEKEIRRPLKNLQVIRGVFLKDLASNDYVKGQIDVKFLSKGSQMSRGMMRLATSTQENPPPGTLENFICLPGYPHPIFSSDVKEADKACNPTNEAEQDQRLTMSTLEKLPENVKAPPEAPKEEDSEKDGTSTSNPAVLPAPKQAKE